MPTSITAWWTEERVAETVTSAYVQSHLRTNEKELLEKALFFGGDLTDDTYLDWILTRARRFFLILVTTGVPDQIFGVVDDSFDDDDLPISEEAVSDLRLSQQPDKSLNKRFYRNQFKFLLREVGDGEHIRYADEETVPIIPSGLKAVISMNKDGLDTVKLPTDSSKAYLRKRVNLESRITEEDILFEIAEMKKFCHEHVISVFASYLHEGAVSILLLPAAEYTLKSFLADSPKAFEHLSKSERRHTLINWPHCLANALSWLHANGGHHGAIRPSNVHVTQNFEIALGQLDGPGLLCGTTKYDDIEAYQYAPPERWKRAVTVQSTGSGKTTLPSGNRTTRKNPSERGHPNDPSSRKRPGTSDGTHPSGQTTRYAFITTSKSDFARLRLSNALEPGMQIAPPPRRSRNVALSDSVALSRSSTGAATDRSTPARPPSALSSADSEGRYKSPSSLGQGIFASAPESRSAVVQTWQSVEHDSFAADIFSLGAVIMDILTMLCKKSYSSFARHRSAKNRNAGRGGGLADASFHANLHQVLLWAQSLSEEAEKKVKKDDSQVLRAVGPVMRVTVQCLERSPEARLSSEALERKLAEHINKFAHIDTLHCDAGWPPENPVDLPTRKRGPEKENLAQVSLQQSDKSFSRHGQTPLEEACTPHPSVSQSTITRPDTESTFVHSSAPSLSLSSLPSMSLDIDSRSETVTVTDSTHSPNLSLHPHFREKDEDAEVFGWKIPEERSSYKPARWGEYQHIKESTVIPRLNTPASESNTDSGAFTYINYSTSPSDDDAGGSDATTSWYSMPPTRPPNRDLPPIPSKNTDAKALSARNSKMSLSSNDAITSRPSQHTPSLIASPPPLPQSQSHQYLHPQQHPSARPHPHPRTSQPTTQPETTSAPARIKPRTASSITPSQPRTVRVELTHEEIEMLRQLSLSKSATGDRPSGMRYSQPEGDGNEGGGGGGARLEEINEETEMSYYRRQRQREAERDGPRNGNQTANGLANASRRRIIPVALSGTPDSGTVPGAGMPRLKSGSTGPIGRTLDRVYRARPG